MSGITLKNLQVIMKRLDCGLGDIFSRAKS
jgi:hypothetical protein